MKNINNEYHFKMIKPSYNKEGFVAKKTLI